MAERNTQQAQQGQRLVDWVRQLNLALKIVPNVRVGEGGSIDAEIEQFVAAMNAR